MMLGFCCARAVLTPSASRATTATPTNEIVFIRFILSSTSLFFVANLEWISHATGFLYRRNFVVDHPVVIAARDFELVLFRACRHAQNRRCRLNRSHPGQ